jgi:hypothetical protein
MQLHIARPAPGASTKCARLASPAPAAQPAPPARPLFKVSGQNLAKGRRTKEQRLSMRSPLPPAGWSFPDLR